MSGQGSFNLTSSGEQISFMTGSEVGCPSATTATLDTSAYYDYFIWF